MADYVCATCHYDGPPRRVKRGSDAVDRGLWLVFPLGVPYTLWRILSKRRLCRHCGSDDLHPVGSAMGKRLMDINTPLPLPKAARAKASLAPSPTLPVDTKPVDAAPIDLVFKPQEPRRPRDASVIQPDNW